MDLPDEDVCQTYLWSVLFATGYLTDTVKPENGIHKLVIPNREILRIYENRIRSWFKIKMTSDTTRWKKFCKAIKTGNAREVQMLFNEFMSESISIRDSYIKKRYERRFAHREILFREICRWAEGKRRL